MAAGDISLNILIGATDKASGVIAGIAGGGALGLVATAALAAGTALVGFGVASVSAAGDFQQSMLKVKAYAGLSDDQMKSMNATILQMATSLGQSPKALADALYPIISSGYSASDALNILTLSGKTAAASGAQMSVVADALTTSLKAMHAPASQAGIYMDDINKIVSLGKGEVPQYAAVIGKLALAAGSAKVPFSDMGAALATLTTHGFPSVAQASTSLGNLFTQIGPKVDAVKQHADKLGLSFNENTFKTLDFADKLAYLNKVTDGNQGELLKLLGGSTVALKAFNALTGSTADFTANLKAMGSAAGTTDSVFKTASSGWNASLTRLNAAFQVLLVSVGSKLLPTLTGLVNTVTPLITGFMNLVAGSSQLSPELQQVAGMFMIMKGNWSDFIGQLQSTLSGPLAQFGQTMGSLLPGFLTQFLRALNLVQLGFMAIAGPLSSVLTPALKILGQVFQGVQQALEPILNALEGQFIPAVQNLASVIAPVIASFLQWVADSGIVTTVLSVLGTVISVVIGVISFLINVISALVVFFSQTAVGAALFKAILIVLAIAIGAIGIVILAVVIPAFIAWVAGAIAVGIANLFAFGPIILVVLAIIAVIAAVILIIQNWGAIVKWLQGVWGGIVSFFQGLWAGIQGVFGGIGAWFTGVFGAGQKGATSAWSGIVDFFQGIWNGIMAAVQQFVQNVVNSLLWLYNHNYYIKNMVDTFVQYFTRLRDDALAIWNVLVAAWKAVTGAIQSAWNAVASWLTSSWHATQGVATSVWNAISGAIMGAVNAVVGWLRSVWTAVSSWIADKWNGFVGLAQAAWKAVSSVFAGIWSNYIAGPLGGLWNSISGWFGNLAGQALKWGENLIQGFINGIEGMLGNVGKAVGDVMGKIGGLLGFHSPTKEGEGQHIIEWGQNMVKGFGEGIQAATPMLHAQIEHLIQPPKLSYAKAAGSAFALSSSPVVHVHITPGEAHVHLDKQKVGHAVMDFAAKEIRAQGALRGR